MELQYAATLLRQCASQFTMLSSDNKQISDQATNFYHRQMAGKAAQTYKNCAAYLLMLADSLPAIRPDLLDVTLPACYPKQETRCYSSKHLQQLLAVIQKNLEQHRQYLKSICPASGHRAGSKKNRRQSCKRKP